MLPGRARVAECGAAPRCRGARSARLSDPPVRVETCRASRCCSEPSTRSACGTSARRNLQYLHVHKPQVSRLGLCAERCGKEPWCSTPKRVHEAPPSDACGRAENEAAHSAESASRAGDAQAQRARPGCSGRVRGMCARDRKRSMHSVCARPRAGGRVCAILRNAHEFCRMKQACSRRQNCAHLRLERVREVQIDIVDQSRRSGARKGHVGDGRGRRSVSAGPNWGSSDLGQILYSKQRTKLHRDRPRSEITTPRSRPDETAEWHLWLCCSFESPRGSS